VPAVLSDDQIGDTLYQERFPTKLDSEEIL